MKPPVWKPLYLLLRAVGTPVGWEVCPPARRCFAWRAAYANPDTYFFVVCKENGDKFDFIRYSPEEFEKFSTIPPFKIFFNVPLDGAQKTRNGRKAISAVRLSEEKLRILDEVFSGLKMKEEKKRIEMGQPDGLLEGLQSNIYTEE